MIRLLRPAAAGFVALLLATACQRGPLQATAHLPATSTSQPVGRDITPNADAAAIIQPYHDKVLAQMQEVLGVAPVALSKNPGENLVVNFVADLQRTAAAQALHEPIALSVMTNGGMRSPIPAGPITLGNVFELMPFENELVVVDAPGPVVQQLFNYAAPVRMAVSGATYSVDADKHPQNILIGGQPFNPAKTYSIAMSDYLAGGGDNMLFLRGVPERSTGLLLRSAIADHIRALTKAGQPVTARIEGRVK
ncbi:5'-nucleotidase C-terminal domain-containing protein [Hymenobacter bucti]|uniref:5'-nucleotidase C-terminal domain-containing protein n=1 Tax=Hymenobacter bucti TaxID=1844114 RepID=A0ABW4QSV2_9BACT